MRKYIDIVEGSLRPAKRHERGERYSDWTAEGEYKPDDELDEIAMEIMLRLNPQELEVMSTCPGAIPIRTDWRLKIALTKWGLSTGNPRSGDNAESLTRLGKIVAKMLSNPFYAATPKS